MNEQIATFRTALQEVSERASSRSDALGYLGELLGTLFGADRVIVAPEPTSEGSVPSPIEWSKTEVDSVDDFQLLTVVANLTSLIEETPRSATAVSEEEYRHHSAAAPLPDALGLPLVCRCADQQSSELTLILFRDRACAWQAGEVELLAEISPILAGWMRGYDSPVPVAPLLIEAPPTKSEPPLQTPSERSYRRLVDNSDAILFTTTTRNVITFVSRRALDFFGVIPEDFLSGIPVEWFDLIHVDDRDAVKQRALDLQQRGLNFEEEFRVINHITGRERWLLVKLVPFRDHGGLVVGWDGFGVDMTARRETQEALDHQSRKVRALYTVSSAIRGYLDPANIAARGLRALCDATRAGSGLCYLYDSPKSRQLKLVAQHGFTGLPDSASVVQQSHLFAHVAERAQPVVIADIATDPRGSQLETGGTLYASAVIVPVAAEDEVFGALGLFHESAGVFDGGDVMLVGAAANQIGLAARQAHLFTVYRKQTKNLSALYRMSHELSNLRSLEETFHQAFTIIRDELGLKRMWLGLVDETGSRIVGQSAYGPGWKRRLIEMNLQLQGEDNPIRDVIASRSPVVVRNPERLLGEAGLRRFFSRFSITSMVLVPLVARGQVLGVLAVQPGDKELPLDDEEMTLLGSLASEIASVILTRRLEERIGEGERMRSAGLLAAGIAHNFNNLLQAILGQASLLEMQRNSPDHVSKAGKIIAESATKGAALVRQLLSFTNLEEAHPVPCDLNDLIQRESRHWGQLLEPGHQLKLSLRPALPVALVDPRHALKILSALIANAVEASHGKEVPIQVFTDVVSSTREPLHTEVPEGRYLRVGVRDRGVGMDAETKRRCFEPFFTTKNVDPGSGLSLSGAGLGLASAYALARRNGGRLVCESRPGSGSIFTFFVPLAVRAELGLAERVEVEAESGETQPATSPSDGRLDLPHLGSKDLKPK